jgi:hypothetical protein
VPVIRVQVVSASVLTRPASVRRPRVVAGPAEHGGEHEEVAVQVAVEARSPRDATTSSTPSVAMASAHFCRAVIRSKPEHPAPTVTTVGMLARMSELLVAVVRYSPVMKQSW